MYLAHSYAYASTKLSICSRCDLRLSAILNLLEYVLEMENGPSMRKCNIRLCPQEQAALDTLKQCELNYFTLEEIGSTSLPVGICDANDLSEC